MQASLKQLRYFVTIADCSKVSEAAKKLHISQPALSSALAQLEEAWGTQLFIRHKSQGVSLTANGELMLVQSRELLRQSNALDDYARELEDQVRGEIQLGCFSTLAPFWIPKLLSEATRVYPDLVIHVTEADVVELNQHLLDGRFELAISYGFGHEDRLRHESLSTCEPYVLLPKTHPLSQQKSLRLQALINEPMVLLDLPHSRDYFTEMFRQTGQQANIAYRSTNFEMIRCMVAAGLGYSLLNQLPPSNFTYNGGELSIVPLVLDTPCKLDVVIVSNQMLKHSVRAQAVMGLLREQIIF